MISPTEDGSPTCLNCGFGVIAGEVGKNGQKIVQCRRFPPAYMTDNDGSPACRFPLVAANNWCGEWEGTHEGN